jgi:hypothetical protein
VLAARVLAPDEATASGGVAGSVAVGFSLHARATIPSARVGSSGETCFIEGLRLIRAAVLLAAIGVRRPVELVEHLEWDFAVSAFLL